MSRDQGAYKTAIRPNSQESPEFDSTTKQLRVLDKFRGLGDCGLQATYSFSKGQPELTLLQGKLNCDGKASSSPRQWKKLPLP